MPRSEVDVTLDDPLIPTHSPLISQAVAGDEDALSSLLQAARGLVFEWVTCRTRDLDDAEDITQGVLLRVLTGLPSFRGESRLSSWLYRITAREIAGFFRKKAREASMAQAWGAEAMHASCSHGIPDRLDWVEFTGAVRDVACALPPSQMEVFRLVDLDGLRPCEAARLLRRTQNGVRSSLCRARRRVRDLVLDSRHQLATELRSDSGTREAA